jgi:hypothetical protein
MLRNLAATTAITILLATTLVPRTAAENEVDFPTRIVITQADLREISEKGTLRGRKVVAKFRRVHGDSLVWDGLRVFTGKKSDIIGWFRTFPQLEAQRMMGGEQFSGAINLRNYQYDMLCSALLQSGDVDIRRAVIWNYLGCGSLYLATDWERAAGDPELSLVDRLVADLRRRAWTKEWPEVFWREYAPRLQPDDLIAVLADGRGYNGMPHGWSALVGRQASFDKHKKLLLPLFKREYLTVHSEIGPVDVIGRVAGILSDFRDEAGYELDVFFLDKLIEWDQLGDERSVVLWRGLTWPKTWNDQLAAKALAFTKAAKIPRNAAISFYRYAGTPVGVREVHKTPDGWQRHFEYYLSIAFAKERDYDQQRFLAELLGYKDRKGKFHETGMVQRMRDGSVVLEVTTEQKKVLEAAWKRQPEALKYVKLKEEQMEEEGPAKEAE